MTNLMLSIIADAQLKRQIFTLKYLSETTLFVTVERIADKLNVTRKTVLSDLKALFGLLPPEIKLESKRGIGVRLIWEEQLPIEDCIVSLVQDTIEFKMLDGIYRGEKHSIAELQKRLFASNTRIRQVIKHINTVIKQFKCSIATQTAEMVGKEINIRYFFYTFYRGMRDLFILRPAEERYTECILAIFEEIRQAGFSAFHFDLRQAAHWFEITVTRMLKGNFVRLDAALASSIKAQHAYQAFLPIYKRITSKLGIAGMPEDEAVWTYVGSLICIIYDDSCFTDENPFAIQGGIAAKISAPLQENLAKLGLDSGLDSQAFKIHKAFLENLYLLSCLTPLVQMRSLYLKNYIIENHEHVYHTWLSWLSLIKQANLYPVKYPRDVGVALTMLTVSIIFTRRASQTHVLFSFHGEPGYSHYLASISKSILPDTIKCTYLCDQYICNDLIEAMGVDIFVSNYDYSAEIQGCALVQFSYIPTIREWTYLKNLTMNMRKGRDSVLGRL